MNETNEFSFVLKPAKYGVGVFAVHDIKEGTLLRVFGDNNPVRFMKKEQVPKVFQDLCANYGDHLICPPDFGYMPVGWYLNHSGTPTAVHDKSETTGKYGLWRAARDISAGEEITIDYNSLEEPENEKQEFYKNDSSMLTVKTKIGQSTIHGIGVFAEESIPKGAIIWNFTEGFDLKFTKEQILKFPKLLQIYLCKYCWKGVKSKLYCFSSDNGKYFNHSENPNVLSAYVDGQDEVVTTAIRDIQAGEELTDNYSSFESDYDQNNILDVLAKKYKLADELDPRLK